MADPDTSAKLKESAAVVSEPWATSTYYDDAERWTFIFWDEDRPFRRLFNRLDLTNLLELSCGHGRHSEQAAEMTADLTLVDIFDANLEFCRNRLQRFPFIKYVKNNGYSFDAVASESVTAIYCYDSMVHFSPDIVQSYLREAARILKRGGMGLFHHSNYAAPFNIHYGQNPHARNHMTKDLFHYFANQAELEIVESIVIDWSTSKDLDCVSLLRKPL
ncbi:MAG TPA: class I SAM-dependent methyltransferase [Xanthobacteraceae bacterium]|nr:class I SAM-dependent methyltransferase [Xanthobacteraceae bacterium]